MSKMIAGIIWKSEMMSYVRINAKFRLVVIIRVHVPITKHVEKFYNLKIYYRTIYIMCDQKMERHDTVFRKYSLGQINQRNGDEQISQDNITLCRAIHCLKITKEDYMLG